MTQLVFIASPFSSLGSPNGRSINLIYAKACLLDSLAKGECPLLPHLTFPELFDDDIDEERTLGIRLGCYWLAKAHQLLVYTDLGISAGMKEEIECASRCGVPITFRSIPHWRQENQSSEKTV